MQHGVQRDEHPILPREAAACEESMSYDLLSLMTRGSLDKVVAADLLADLVVADVTVQLAQLCTRISRCATLSAK